MFVGNGIENCILVVAMHLTKSGKYNRILNVIGTPTHPLHSLGITSILYSCDHVFDDNRKKEAVKDINCFLFSSAVDNPERIIADCTM